MMDVKSVKGEVVRCGWVGQKLANMKAKKYRLTFIADREAVQALSVKACS